MRDAIQSLGLCALVLVAACGGTSPTPAEPRPVCITHPDGPVRNPDLRLRLLAAEAEDQRVRQPGPGGVDDPEFLARMRAVDRANAAFLDSVVRACGWPVRSLVATDGAHAAWIIAQHAPLPLQRTALALMRAAAPGEVEPRDVALLLDRVRLQDGLPQYYGSQFTSSGDRLVLWPLDKPACADPRRRGVGLGTMAENIERLRRSTGRVIEWSPPAGECDDPPGWSPP